MNILSNNKKLVNNQASSLVVFVHFECGIQIITRDCCGPISVARASGALTRFALVWSRLPDRLYGMWYVVLRTSQSNDIKSR